MGCVRIQYGLGKEYIKHFNHLEAVKRYKLKNKEKVSEYHRQYYQKSKKSKEEDSAAI